MAERYGLTETEWNERLDGIQHTAERAHAEIALHAGLLAAHDGRLTELENAHAVRGVNTRQELDTHAERLEGLKVVVKNLNAAMQALEATTEALSASVGVARADLEMLKAQEPVRVLVARLEALSDERNAARRSQMEVAAERADARRERDAATQTAELYRVTLMRVRRGDLVRCLACQGYAAAHGVMCAACTDDHGEPRYGVAGLVPPAANAPLVADVELTPEELKP